MKSIKFESLNLVDDGSSKGGRADKKDKNNDKKGDDGSTESAEPESQTKPTDTDDSNKQSGNNFKTTQNSIVVEKKTTFSNFVTKSTSWCQQTVFSTRHL